MNKHLKAGQVLNIKLNVIKIKKWAERLIWSINWLSPEDKEHFQGKDRHDV